MTIVSKRLYFASIGTTVHVYDNHDVRETKMPIASIQKRKHSTNGRYYYSIFINGDFHSKHIDLEHAKAMLIRMYPVNERVEWLAK